jgi:receptor protein-tyrosine kinase
VSTAEHEALRAADAGSGESGPGTQFAPSDELTVVHRYYSDRAERIRALRTELLLYAGMDSGGCTIAVVSPGGRDGRSRLAAELAAAFAQLQQPTLLVDADLRRPAQHRLFGAMHPVAGLADALSAGSVPEAHPVARLPALSLVPAGTLPPQPLDLLSDRHLATLVEGWRRDYRFVIFDTPPAGEYADGLAVAHVAGRALLVTCAGRSTFQDSRALLRRLTGSGVEILGAVLNRL